jgi:cytosine/adenosine deaminase-related metal-dependent hydrolase
VTIDSDQEDQGCFASREAPTRRDFGALAASALLSIGATTPAQPHQGLVEPKEVVLECGWALVTDGPQDREPRLIRDAQILVRRGRVEEVRASRIPGAHRIALPNDLVLPGFISGHTHVASGTPTRGLIEGGRTYRRPIELVEELGPEDLDALTALNLAELVRSGCTTQVEMSLSLKQAESYTRVAKGWGVRGYPGGMIPSTGRLFPIWYRGGAQELEDSVPETLKEIEANLAFGLREMNTKDGLIRPMMSPHATDTHTPQTMRALIEAAKKLGTGIHIHLSQGARETATVKRLRGKTPTQWLEELGALEAGPVFGAHMAGLDWSVDPDILNRHGVVYAHCPSAGGAGASAQPFPEALSCGMNVNIGIDTHSNDYLENLKLAVLYGRMRARLLKEGPRGALPLPTIRQAVDAATLVPARGLRRDDLGRIAQGAAADLVSVDVTGLLSGTGELPPEPLNLLLYANGRHVRTVMIAGRLLVENFRLTFAEEARLMAGAGVVQKRLWAQLEKEGWFKA